MARETPPAQPAPNEYCGECPLANRHGSEHHIAPGCTGPVREARAGFVRSVGSALPFVARITGEAQRRCPRRQSPPKPEQNERQITVPGEPKGHLNYLLRIFGKPEELSIFDRLDPAARRNFLADCLRAWRQETPPGAPYPNWADDLRRRAKSGDSGSSGGHTEVNVASLKQEIGAIMNPDDPDGVMQQLAEMRQAVSSTMGVLALTLNETNSENGQDSKSALAEAGLILERLVGLEQSAAGTFDAFNGSI